MWLLLGLVSTCQALLLPISAFAGARYGLASTLCCWDTKDVVAFPAHQPQAFWGRAAWGRGDVDALRGTCAQFCRGAELHSFCVESISSN